MRILTFAEVHNNFKSVLDSTIDNAEVTIIHGSDGEDVVLMGRDYYNSLQETLYLLGNPANAKALFKSIVQYKAGLTQERQLLNSGE